VCLGYLKSFGSVTVLNGHIHQVMQWSKVTSPSTRTLDGISAARARFGAFAQADESGR
jgi:hypothetical protein